MAKMMKSSGRERAGHGEPAEVHGRPDDADRGRTGNAAAGNDGGVSGKRIGGARAAAMAREQLEELLQRPCEAVSGLSRQPDGWVVVLEVVELERVPPTTDILGTYRVQLDADGELMGYERTNRYYRNQAGGDD